LNLKLTEQDKKKIIELIEAGKTLPAVYKSKLFDRDDNEFINPNHKGQLCGRLSLLFNYRIKEGGRLFCLRLTYSVKLIWS